MNNTKQKFLDVFLQVRKSMKARKISELSGVNITTGWRSVNSPMSTSMETLIAFIESGVIENPFIRNAEDLLKEIQKYLAIRSDNKFNSAHVLLIKVNAFLEGRVV